METVRRQLPVVGSNGINLLRQYIHIRSGRRVSRPSQIYVNVNQRCNLQCKYCDNWKSDGSNELPKQTWLRALDDLLSWARRPKVNISGGEPLMRKDIYEILDLCVQKGALTGVVSNGYYFTPKPAPRIAGLGLTNINISIDSLDPAVFDVIRVNGRAGHTGRVVESIQRIAHEVRRQGADTKIYLKTVITGANLGSLVPLVEFVEENGLDGIMFQPLEAVFGRREDFGDDWFRRTDLWPDDPALAGAAVAQLAELKAAGAPIMNPSGHIAAWAPYFRDPLAGATGQIEGTGTCTIGHSHLYLNFNGDIHLCWDFPPIGNIASALASQQWISAGAEDVRRDIAECTKPCTKTCLLDRGLKETVSAYRQLVAPRSRDEVAAAGDLRLDLRHGDGTGPHAEPASESPATWTPVTLGASDHH